MYVSCEDQPYTISPPVTFPQISNPSAIDKTALYPLLWEMDLRPAQTMNTLSFAKLIISMTNILHQGKGAWVSSRYICSLPLLASIDLLRLSSK